jgi:hypothetical protein
MMSIRRGARVNEMGVKGRWVLDLDREFSKKFDINTNIYPLR